MMFFNIKGKKVPNLLSALIALFISAAMLSILTGAMVDIQAKKITLVMVDAFAEKENTTEITTRQNLVSEFIEENGIQIGEYDRVSMLMDDKLYDGAVITVRKGRKLTLNIDNNIEIITTTKKTVREAFEEAGVTINQNDRVEPDPDSEVTEDMNVNVYRVRYQLITVDKEIPFKSCEVADTVLERGKTYVKVNGENGIERTEYEITTENGKEISRRILSRSVIKSPVEQVIAVGTKKAQKQKAQNAQKASEKQSAQQASTTTKSGEKLNYSKKITVTATAYTSNGGKTASGKVAQYGVIAVDPKVIPLGTKLFVESTDDGKTWSYGYCVAGDTGGAIKGNKIDLFFGTNGECVQFGRRSANVYVLN